MDGGIKYEYFKADKKSNSSLLEYYPYQTYLDQQNQMFIDYRSIDGKTGYINICNKNLINIVEFDKLKLKIIVNLTYKI